MKSTIKWTRGKAPTGEPTYTSSCGRFTILKWDSVTWYLTDNQSGHKTEFWRLSEAKSEAEAALVVEKRERGHGMNKPGAF